MLDPLLQPAYLLLFVPVAWWLGHPGASSAPGVRRVVFIAVNMAILGGVVGTWKGLGFYIVLVGALGCALRWVGPGKRYSGLWCAALVLGLVLALVAAKYIVPVLPVYSVKATLAVRQIWNTISLSFLTFRLIHVVVDAHDGLIEKPGWCSLFGYAFFAPVSVAGPIQKFQDFHSQFSDPKPLTSEAFLAAFQRLVVGIAKKVLIAGPLTPYVLGNMEPSGGHPLLMLILACALYSVYIYVDFSGYTDIAIGAAALFGITLPENFDRPWLATNLQDFWNRWHITFSHWLRTYLFYPINKFLVYRFPSGGKRANPVIAILVTFAIAGAWHGDGWNFLVFGLMHGMGIAAFFLVRRNPAPVSTPVRMWVGRAATFAYVSAVWIPFVYPLQEIPWLLRIALG